MFKDKMHELSRSGSIEVVCGSMFSGKTEELIRRVKRAQIAKQKVYIFKPTLDIRYSKDDVVSHDQTSISAIPIENARLIIHYGKDADVIAIDEAQFFDHNVVEVAVTMAAQGKRVICAGLDMDFLGHPFGPMPELMAVADEVYKTRAICVRCGRLANFSYRTAQSNELVLLGETKEYEPLCRSCYNELMNPLKED
ncbi:MAG: thymidine kinase [Bacteroidales bacterium]|nr:thymidine kinase [Bacteroidales bacterium]